MGRGARMFKWLVVPALAALLGYYVVAPTLKGRSKRVIESLIPLKNPPKAAAQGTPSDSPEAPKVTVGVHPVDESDPPDEETPRRRRRR